VTRWLEGASRRRPYIRETTGTEAEDALDFLEQWPLEKRGMVFEMTQGALYADHDARLPMVTARRVRRMGSIGGYPGGCFDCAGMDDGT
jgi:hypothetical protein